MLKAILLFLFINALCIKPIVADGGSLDVILLLDSSDAYRSSHFQSEKDFAKSLSGRLLNGSVQIGLYTFGANTHRQFPLDATKDKATLNQQITYLWFSTGDGNLGPAINFTIHDGFTESSGDRECVPNILIILTHTTVSDDNTRRFLTELLDERIVRVFVLNMAANAGGTLVDLTNDTKRVIPVNSFADLNSKVDDVIRLVNTDPPRSGCGQLTGWGTWSRCSRTCSKGLKLRFRECTKIRQTDKDCEGVLSEDQDCNNGDCREAIDGGWSNWQKWSACSKSCGIGTQVRTRTCDEPERTNGGKPCVGRDIQNRTCADFECPDCNRPCPPGAHLKNCSYCVCSHVSLYGRIMDNINEPVKNAQIYLQSMRYQSIATTNEWGYFNTTSVCLLNEIILVQKIGYETLMSIKPVELNSTHWTLNATVYKYVPPIITVQPEDKLRRTGQTLILCCQAAGYPNATEYKWYKNGTELEGVGTDGTLTITSVQLSDHAVYKCSVETEAGVTQSETANVVVIESTNPDTCSSPLQKLQLLPEGCYVEGDPNKNRTIDVKTCDKSKCLTSGLVDNGTCSDWWTDHCCDVGNVETVNITCDGYSYRRTVAKTCVCRPCVQTTVISGRVFGRNGSQEVPMKLGVILSNGQEVGTTNMAGYFRFQVPKGVKRVVATFHDEVFKLFVDSTKIISIAEGQETSVTIVVPLKPKPVKFTPSLGTSIELGSKSKGVPAAGSLSIESDSLMTAEGHPYTGPAKASVHFMDPRHREDLETSNGDFVYENQAGEKMPLRTFGMFHVGVEDEQGNSLNINKDITFNLDASLFNVSLDENGDPDLALWYFDTNKGIWVEQSKMKFSSGVSDGRRRLLAGAYYTGTVPPFNVPIMDPYTYTVEKRWTGRYTNCDHSVKIYEDVKIKNDKPKDGVCYVSVTVYTDLTMTETDGKGGVQVTAFSQELDESAYLATETNKVDADGHVCMTIFCDKLVYINAKGQGNRPLLPSTHFLPRGYSHTNREKEHEVTFESRFLGKAYDCATDTRSKNCNGPIFPYSEASICQKSGRDDSFRFKFAPFTKIPELLPTIGTTEIYDHKLSWYPMSPDKKFYRTCFLKVSVKAKDQYDLRLTATSYQGHDIYSEQYGTYDVGPEPSPDMKDKTTRGACIEYRCAGLVKDGSNVYYDRPTTVKVMLTAGGKPTKCKPRLLVRDVNITMTTAGSGFVFVSESGRNYGPKYGVYVNDADRTTVQNFCYSGTDFSSQVDGILDPTKKAAVEFDCMSN